MQTRKLSQEGIDASIARVQRYEKYIQQRAAQRAPAVEDEWAFSEMLIGEGNIVYEVKIPFLTHQYLQETDETMKRYYYCHCPWAREAIKRNNDSVPASFCNCSAGFHKRKWEVIFGQKLRAEVLESVLNGDPRCRFAIYLPETA